MKKLILATNNKNKLKEIRSMMSDSDIEIVSLADVGLDIEIEETGETFEENSFIKAKAVFDRCHIPTIADDSGLMVFSLGGAPGVYSARYSGENATDAKNDALLLKNLEGKSREAKYVSVITFYDGVTKYHTTGETYGHILEEKRGTNGFGYDGLFFSEELRKSFGEASEEEKNKVSHRAKAMAKMADWLKANLK